LPDFIREVADLFLTQEADFKKAFAQERGKYSVRPQFKSQLKCEDYFKMNPRQRQAFFKRVEKTTLIDLHSGATTIQTGRIDMSQTSYLTVTADAADVAISNFVLREIWMKASTIVRHSVTACAQAPCRVAGVSKYSVLRDLHHSDDLVTVTWDVNSGKFGCPCAVGKVHALCEHTVATAEINDQLEEFLGWHRRTNKSTNSHSQATSQYNLGAMGQKGGQLRRKRKLPPAAAGILGSSPTPQCQNAVDHLNKLGIRRLCGTQIRMCNGCHHEIRQPPVIPPPPNDVVFAAHMRYSFTNPHTGLLKITRGWKHFHFKSQCIRKHINLGFHICNSIIPALQNVHRDYLARECGIHVIP
jgi:hypothetical protein